MNERETEHDGFCSCFSLESKTKGEQCRSTQTCRRLLDDCLFCFLALALSPVRRSALSVLFSSQRSRLSPSASLPSHSHAASLPLHSHAARRLERTGGGRHRLRSSFAGNDGQARSFAPLRTRTRPSPVRSSRSQHELRTPPSLAHAQKNRRKNRKQRNNQPYKGKRTVESSSSPSSSPSPRPPLPQSRLQSRPTRRTFRSAASARRCSVLRAPSIRP